MPVIDLEPQPIGAPLTTPEKAFVTPGEEDISERPSFMDTLGATFRQENLIGAGVSSNRLGVDSTPDGINPWDQIKGTQYEPHFESFVNVRNQREFDAVQQDIDREIQDRKTIAAAPLYQSLPAALMSTVVDPTILLPGGAFYRGAKGGFALGKTAMSVGIAAGAQSAVQELGLQALQSTRTLEESAINIGSSTLLGGLLGWGGAALLTRGELRGAAAALDRQLGATGGDAAEIIADIKPKLIAAGMSEEEASANAAIVVARYTTRAERLGEGTGADLYRADMAEVRGPGAVSGDAAIDPATRQFFQSGENAPTFYSSVLRSVETAKQEKAPAAQWLGTLKNTPGVKPEEMDWLGLEGWLKEQKGTVTKQQIADYVRANQIEVREVEKGDKVIERPDRAPVMLNDTKFSQYTLPGGKNYRELLLTLPQTKGTEFDPSKVVAKKLIDYGDNASFRLSYDGKEIGTFTDYTSQPRTQDEWIDVVRRRFAGDPNLGIKPMDTENYRSSHFDEPNILAHVRFNDRVIDGKRTLFLEEVQSDWHQAGKRKGYRTDEPVDPRVELREVEARLNDIDARHPYNGDVPFEQYLRSLPEQDAADYRRLAPRQAELIEAANRFKASQGRTDSRVPDAPFKTTWPELSLKRMIRYAAENGYEQIAWTTGKTQAARYDLSKQIDGITYAKSRDGSTVTINAERGGDHVFSRNNVPIDEVDDLLGKEIADRIRNDVGDTDPSTGYRELRGLDLQVGGEGMSGFYDKMLPAAANKLVKKYGGKVERGELPTSTRDGEGLQNQFNDLIEEAGGTPTMASRPTSEPVHVLPLTDKMKEAALGEGFPLFQGGEAGPRGRITLSENKAIIDLFKGADQSTFMHEAGHLWLDELVRDAARGNVPQAIKDDLGTVLRWLKVDKVEDIGRAQHEQWAQAFERYLADGKAPSSALAQAFEKFKQWLTAIYKSLTDMGAPLSDDVRGVMDRLLATDAEIAQRGVPQGAVAGSVGAAAVMAPSLVDTAIAGRAAGAAAYATARLNPGLRIAHSESAEARNVGFNLFEMSQYIRGNEDGFASPQAVETLRKQWDGGLASAVRDTASAYSDFRKAGGQLSRSDFQAEVGKAMRRGDQSQIPEVAKVAQTWRKEVFDPLKQAAIDSGLLPADVSVETAISYFSRLWNRKRLIAEEGQFKAVVQQWVADNYPRWLKGFEASAERRLEPLRREIADLEMAKLRRGEEAKQRGEGELTEGDEGYIRQAIRIVRGGAPKPKGVETLTQFVKSAGGLVEDSGELRHMGISNKSMPGLLRKEKRRIGPNNKVNDGGWDVDSMARHAWEHGYFPEHSERPSRNEFLEALSDDFNKRRAVVRQEDRDAYRFVDLVNKLEEDLARLGVDPAKGARFSTSEEVKGIVKRVFKALDAEADRKIASLKEALIERQSRIDEEREVQFKGDVNEMGRDIASEVFDTLTGRTSDGTRPEFITVKSRGPLKERTFNIPDEMVERWLESDIDLVGRRYTRVMSSDVELARKFGSPDMGEAIAKVREDYNKLRAGVTDEKRLTALAKQERADIRDLEGVRDLIRGNFAQAAWEKDFGAIVRMANAAQYILKMGQVVLSSLTEPVRVVAAKGLTPFMRDAFAGMSNPAALKLSIEEARLAGNITDKILAARLSTVADLTDFYGSRGPVEKFIDNMTNVASTWNGIRLWTDGVKMLAGTMIQNKILDNVARFGEIGAKDKRYLAFLGIDESMAGRIAKQFADHGDDVQGVRVAGTANWTDDVARRAYRAALNKDLDSMVVTRGAADLPLFANTPMGKLLFQFNSFNLASHQRVLLRGLQEGPARFLSGVIALSSMGMLQTYLTALATNSVNKLPDFQENYGWWLSEGLDKAGIFQVPMQIANGVEKLVGTNPIKAPIKAWDVGKQGSQKNRNRNELGLLGPSAGTLQDIGTVATIARSMSQGEDVSKAQKNAAERLLPFNSYAGIRWILKYFINPPTE